MALIRIGTAGWAVPSALRPDFPSHGTLLEKYASRMKAVEINSSFYRPHQRKTYQRWVASVPADFRFSVKLPRSITHERRLADFEEPLARFLEDVSGLGAKLGVILVQLPPSLAFQAAAAEELFAALAKMPCGLACEPRHGSWFAPEADAVLRRRGVARVAADPPRHPADGVPGGARRLAYYRWHGAPKTYWSAYGEETLAALAETLRVEPAEEAWCIFDNTAAGAALDDALRLKAMVS